MALRVSGRMVRRLLIGAGVTGGAVLAADRLFKLKPRQPGEYKKITTPENDALTRHVWRLRVPLRLLHLFLLFLPLVVLHFVVSLYPHHRRLEEWYYRRIKQLLEFAGPAFVKLGQWAVTRSDLFPPEFCRVLSELHYQVTPHGLKWSKYLVEKELGRRFDEVFAEFDPVPLGSGSIAQVHRAQLRETGEWVAVKVCHPRVMERIALDFYCIQWVADRLHPLAPLYNLKGIAEQFNLNLSLQVDLRYEAANLERFAENFALRPGQKKEVMFPRPNWKYTTQKVMIEELVPGEPISNYFHGADTPSTPVHRHLAESGLEIFLQMLLTDNFLHADMHPGNILVGFREGKDRPFVCLVDAGVTQTLSERERDTVFYFMSAINRKDPVDAAKAILSMSDSQEFCDPAAFAADIKGVFDELIPPPPPIHWSNVVGVTREWLKRIGVIPYRQRSQGHVAEVVMGMFGEVRKHKVKLDPQYASLLFTAMMQEDVLNSIDPDYDVVTHSAAWFISSFWHQLVGMEKCHVS